MSDKSTTLKGFRDFLPSQMAVRNAVKKICIDAFELFGFEPLETPTLEYASVLKGKNGQEADKLLYTFKDKGDREVGLKYDLTVPTARVLSTYNLSLPFKRYQIQPVFRADNTQKGRYREFLQCDIDIFGFKTPNTDAEIIAITYYILSKLNFKKFSIRINSRTVLKQILTANNIEKDQNSVLQSLDKFQKIGEDGVKKELIKKGFDSSQIDKLFEYIKTAQPDDYLNKVFGNLIDFGIPSSAFTFDPTLVRGLDYYTGPIFETYIEDQNLGSVTGGGRYDDLVKTLGGPDIPAVGTTIGLDRIVDCINELNLLPELIKTKTRVLVANFGEEKKSLELISKLRQENIPSSFYPSPEKLGKQIKYANTLGIKYIAIIGPDEAKNKLITIKNLLTSEQKTINFDELIKEICYTIPYETRNSSTIF